MKVWYSSRSILGREGPVGIRVGDGRPRTVCNYLKSRDAVSGSITFYVKNGSLYCVVEGRDDRRLEDGDWVFVTSGNFSLVTAHPIMTEHLPQYDTFFEVYEFDLELPEQPVTEEDRSRWNATVRQLSARSRRFRVQEQVKTGFPRLTFLNRPTS